MADCFDGDWHPLLVKSQEVPHIMQVLPCITVCVYYMSSSKHGIASCASLLSGNVHQRSKIVFFFCSVQLTLDNDEMTKNTYPLILNGMPAFCMFYCSSWWLL